jgi:hypothetical protein
MGIFIEIGNSNSILEVIDYCLINQEKLLDISRFNEKYARNHFGADRVAANLINAIQDL